MKKIFKALLLLILFAFLLPLIIGPGQAPASAAPDDKVDLTKIQFGHFKVYDWKEGEEKKDITGATFDGKGGDMLWCALFDPEDYILFVIQPNREMKGRDDTRGAFFFSPWLCNDPGCPDCDTKPDFGNMWVLKKEIRDEFKKQGLKGKKALEELIKLSKLINDLGPWSEDCEGMERTLKNQPAGVYKLQPFGQEGDQILNPLDEFNKFELAPPLVFDLTSPNNPEVRGMDENKESIVLRKGPHAWEKTDGKLGVYAKSPKCQGSHTRLTKNDISNYPYSMIFYIHAGKGGGLEAVMRFILNIIRGVIERIISWVASIVDTYVIIDTADFSDPNAPVVENWRMIRDICNILFVLVLLAVAFLNLLGEGIDVYTIKKTLPKFLLAIILVNLSLLMCKLIIDFSNVLSNTFSAIAHDYPSVVTEQVGAAAGQIAGDIPAAIMALIMTLIGLIAALLVIFLLIFRVIMIWLLLMLSPFVFLLWVLPPTQKLFTTWWNQFIKYVFMGPAIVLILAFAKRVAGTIGKGGEAAEWIKLLFASGMLIAAAAVPMALGGKAMGAVAGVAKGLGKKAGAKAWGATGAKAGARLKEGYMARVGEKRGLIGKIPRTGRARAKTRAETAKIREPIYAEMGWDRLENKAKRGDAQAAKQLIREGQAHRLEGSYKKLPESVRKMAAETDPIAAGLEGEHLSKFLETADASRFSAQGTKNLLEKGNLQDHHIEAITTRGSQAGINALHDYYAENPTAMPAAGTVASRALLHSAFSSKDAGKGAAVINKMDTEIFKGRLQHVSPGQVTDWQKSGVIDGLDNNQREAINNWAKGNKGALDDLSRRGKISQGFYDNLFSPPGGTSGEAAPPGSI